MKTRILIPLVLASLLASIHHAEAQFFVWRANFNFSSFIQGQTTGTNATASITGTTATATITVTNATATILRRSFVNSDIINLALGRPLGTRVPANEVLAVSGNLTSTQLTNLQMFVIDTNTLTNLAAVAVFGEPSSAVSGNTIALGVTGIITPAGTAQNALAGGRLQVTGTTRIASLESGDIRFTSNFLGVVSNIVSGVGQEVIIQSGRFGFGGLPLVGNTTVVNGPISLTATSTAPATSISP